MNNKIIMILFTLISVTGAAKVTCRNTAQQNTSIIPTYSLWCVVNPYVSISRVNLERRWACANGANCSAIETGGLCQDLYYDRSGASYAFNDYYQKNPLPKNCDFNGTAKLTIQDPSTPTCKFPSNSTGPFPLTSSVSRTATPNLGNFLWGLGFTYLAYIAAQIA